MSKTKVPEPRFRTELISPTALKVHGYTTTSFAEACALSRSAVQSYQEGKSTPGGKALVAIERVLRGAGVPTSLGHLMSVEERPRL